MYTISLRTYISFELLEKRICKVSWLCGLDRLFFCIFLTVYLLLVPNCSFKASRRKKKEEKREEKYLILVGRLRRAVGISGGILLGGVYLQNTRNI